MICRILQKLYLFIHHRMYAKRLVRQRRFGDVRVVSIGNLSAGGTGKTPVTALLAGKLIGLRPLAVLRGYRGGSSSRGVLVSDGDGTAADARAVGDEAAMLAAIPGLRVAVCRDRAEAIRRWRDDSKLILLDDAFQNPSVFRDHELVLIDATLPPEGVKVIPCGRFREGIDALVRADTVLFTRTDLTDREHLNRWIETVRSVTADAELFSSIHRVEGIIPELDTRRQAAAFCGIGNPDSFFGLLDRAGFNIIRRTVFPDHHEFNDREVENLSHNSTPLITTEKDYVRLKGAHPEFAKKIHYLKIGFGITDGREREFLERVAGTTQL